MKTSIKAIISALGLSLLITTASFAQTGDPTQDPTMDQQELQQEENKTEIAPEELPEEISTAITDGEYAEWQINRVYVVSKMDETIYEVHFTNPQGETEIAKYDQEGNEVDE